MCLFVLRFSTEDAETTEVAEKLGFSEFGTDLCLGLAYTSFRVVDEHVLVNAIVIGPPGAW